MKNKLKYAVGALLIIAALFIGYKLGSPADAQISDQHEYTGEQQKDVIWTCSMHPQIRLPDPGQCPICGMDLIVAKDDSGGSAARGALKLGENALALMDVELHPVERRFVTADIRMSGKIDYDETRISYITAWTGGRLDRLYVDYTGVPVKKGDHMVYMYSPELVSAQEAYLQALGASGSGGEVFRQINDASLKAAREKLLLLGLTEQQVEDIKQRGKASDHITIYSPISGIVIHKDAVEGMYVKTGTRIYTVADMSRVWARLDAYESDMEWIRYGQKVKFTTISYPGRQFEGVISFIDPILDEKTRTVKLRLDVDNSDGLLKPGMFVNAVVQSNIAAGGRVMETDMAGKWICPMHPGVVKDDAGDCDICGMPLVTTESLGYVSEAGKADKPLVIPVSAALVTGKRAVAYVKLPDDEGGPGSVFGAREIVLGPRAEDYYIVEKGLSEGELVVTKGNFKIDSSLQIKASGGMMDPERNQPSDQMTDAGHMGHTQINDMPKGSLSEKFTTAFAKVVNDYFDMQDALASDDFEAAVKSLNVMAADLQKIDMKELEGGAHERWMELSMPLKAAIKKAQEPETITVLREHFYRISQRLQAAVDYFGAPTGEAIYLMHCPMAFDDAGADWLQKDETVLNPYFGSQMLHCGFVKETFTDEDNRESNENEQ